MRRHKEIEPQATAEKNRQPLYKRRQGLVVAGVILGIILLYVLMSFFAWKNMKSHSDAVFGNVNRDLKIVMGQASSRGDRLKALESLNERYDEVDKLCQTEWWYSWQSVIPQNTSMLVSCKAKKTAIQATKPLVQQLLPLIKNENSLSDILSGLNGAGKELTEETWSKAKKAAEETLNKIKSMNTSKEYTPVKDRAEAVVTDVTTNWIKLEQAHTAKNKQEFTGATDALDHSYQGFATVEAASNALLSPKLDKLTATLAEIKL